MPESWLKYECLWAARVASFGRAESGTWGRDARRVFGQGNEGLAGFPCVG